MLRKLLKSSRTAPVPAAIPAGQRIYAIGDVHGCLSLLNDILDRIERDDAARPTASTTLIFIGDVIDRGPHSAQVVGRLIDLANSRIDTRFIKGNHEELFLSALDGDEAALRTFCRSGGRETAISYGIDPSAYERMDYAELLSHLRQLVPDEHRAFLSGFEDMVIVGDYAFVHAGVRPGVTLAEQRASSLRWIRDPFLDYRGGLEKRIVHGHTISEEPAFMSHRIGIDTGAFRTGHLTALSLENGASWILQTSVSR